MDNVSRMEDLKLDSHSEMIDKDDGGKDLFSPAMIPLNTPTIGSKPEESESEDDEESEDEEIEAISGEVRISCVWGPFTKYKQ
ncbi:unnamed protein product [Prunus armeniaca]